MAELGARFVRVRITAMDGVDLSRFQFDFDMSWAGFFLHPDGTVLGRYGSRDSGPREAHAQMSLAGLARAMERALALYDAYPANRGGLAGKQSPPLEWRTIEQVPTRKRMGFGACYHCHHVGEALTRARIQRGEGLVERDVWPFPPPSRIGLSLDPSDDAVVTSVAEGSPSSGVVVEGDRLLAANRQPLVSRADLQWVLDHLDDEATLELDIERDGEPMTVEVSLALGWRRGDARWRESRWTLRPGVAWRRLDPDERARQGVSDGMALLVTRVYGKAVRKGGPLQGDVMVEFDGVDDDLLEGDVLLRLRRDRRPGDRVAIVVLRDGERRELELEVD